jgi:murein L,D-transpeptidase YcbB/YkuD
MINLRVIAVTLAALMYPGMGSVAQALVAPPSPSFELRAALVDLRADPTIAGQGIADLELLGIFYQRRDYRPAWESSARLDALLEAIRGSFDHGLRPDDYHLESLEALGAAAPGRTAGVRLDLLATAAAARLAAHLRFGKVDPEKFHPGWNFNSEINMMERVELLEEVLGAADLRAALGAQAPDSDYYRGLVRHLAHHRELAALGGWPEVSPGETLRPGMLSPRVPELRARLAASGDLAVVSTPADPLLFDAELEAAVRRFQLRHELLVDGLAGKRTLAAMNVPVAARIDQLRVNLERARWVFRDLEPRFLLVNIARFRVLLLEDGEIRWSTRAVVGRPYRQTPVFRATMTHLELNPRWTVPPTIFREDLLPQIRQDPGVLERRNMQVLDWGGQPIDPWSVDWRRVDGNRPPYFIRQAPGPYNPLGRVKFIYPNQHQVYMHDTPERELFSRAERSFSSGCIRLQRPLELAQLLLEGSVAEQQRMDAALRSGETVTIALPRPIPVFTLYGTAVPEDGRIHFASDVYSRDGALLAALDAPRSAGDSGGDNAR